MSVPNYSSRKCWGWQTAEGTAAITLAGSTSYRFGMRIDDTKWQSPSGKNPIFKYYPYSQRNPKINKSDRRVFDPIQENFKPTTPHFLNWILGDPTENGHSAGVHTIDLLHTGIPTPITIRNEELGGTNPTHVQAVDAYCNKIIATAIRTMDLEVQAGFQYANIQDVGDYVMLTTAPLACGGNDVSNCYQLSEILHDDGEAGETEITNIEMVQLQIDQDFSNNLDGSNNIVRKHTYDSFGLDLHAVHPDDKFWNDYIDRGVIDIGVTFTKPDGTTYIKVLCENCNPIGTLKEGKVKEGLIQMVHYECEKMTVPKFTFEGATSFSTIFKGELT